MVDRWGKWLREHCRSINHRCAEQHCKSAEIVSKTVRKRQMKPRMQNSPVGHEIAMPKSVLDDENTLSLMGMMHTYPKACQPKPMRNDHLWANCWNVGHNWENFGNCWGQTQMVLRAWIQDNAWSNCAYMHLPCLWRAVFSNSKRNWLNLLEEVLGSRPSHLTVNDGDQWEHCSGGKKGITYEPRAI